MPIDDYPGDTPGTSAGKYIEIEVPDFSSASGTRAPLTSYLRIGAVKDATRAGKAPPKAAAGEAQQVVSFVGPATAANVPVPLDPTGEDLASLVQGFADDTRVRGNPSDPDGAGYGTATSKAATTKEGPILNYPQDGSVPADASAPKKPPIDPVTGQPIAGYPPPLAGSPSPQGVNQDYDDLDGYSADFLTTDYRALESAQLHTKGGWRDHTDGNRITTTRGDKVEVIRGNYKLIVLGRQDMTKPKFAGMDISGGSNTSDLNANAGTDQSTLSTIIDYLQCDDGIYRSVTITKTGSGVPSLGSTGILADTSTWTPPLGSVKINETWGYESYTYTGVEMQKVMSGASGPPLGPGVTGTGGCNADTRGWIWPLVLNVTETHVQEQRTTNYVGSQSTVTQGPSVILPGTGMPPGTGVPAGNGIRDPAAAPTRVTSISNETHVETQRTTLDAGTTTTTNNVGSQTTTNNITSQTTTNNVGSTYTETHVDSQATRLFAGTSDTFNSVGAQSTMTRVGAQSTILLAGATSNMTVSGAAGTLTVNALAAAIKSSLVDLTITIGLVHAGITIAPRFTVDFPKKTEVGLTKQEIAALHTALHGTAVQVNGPSGTVSLAPLHVIS